jgi:hypothetical protein
MVEETKGEPRDLGRVASYLSRTYPEGRPPILNDALLKKIATHVGSCSPRTLNRAIDELGWPKR